MKWPVVIGTGFMAVVAAILLMRQTGGDGGGMTRSISHETAFFATAEAAVATIREMIVAEDWAALAPYYDLDGSEVNLETLLSGEFFIETEQPEIAHPAGFWRYKHPFPPSFDYDFATLADDDGIVTVRVSIRIDQGAGEPVQEGWQEFRLRESEDGLKILPD